MKKIILHRDKSQEGGAVLRWYEDSSGDYIVSVTEGNSSIEVDWRVSTKENPIRGFKKRFNAMSESQKLKRAEELLIR